MKVACEQCEVAISPQLMIGWVHVEPAGEVDTSSFGTLDIEAVYCSVTCMMTWFIQNQGNHGVNQHPAHSIQEVQ